jgi:hypothetical protein
MSVRNRKLRVCRCWFAERKMGVRMPYRQRVRLADTMRPLIGPRDEHPAEAQMPETQRLGHRTSCLIATITAAKWRSDCRGRR